MLTSIQQVKRARDAYRAGILTDNQVDRQIGLIVQTRLVSGVGFHNRRHFIETIKRMITAPPRY